MISVWGTTEGGSEVMELRAVQDIQPDVEITADYIADRSFLAQPQQRLRLHSSYVRERSKN